MMERQVQMRNADTDLWAAGLCANMFRQSPANLPSYFVITHHRGLKLKSHASFDDVKELELDHKHHLGNPLTTSNDAPDKSRMRFLGVSGGIFLKMLFWKIYGFSKITFTSINCFGKDLFTIVVAISAESYFALHIC